MTPDQHAESGCRVSLDQVFSALSHQTRRRILSTLVERNPSVSSEFESTELAASDELLQAASVSLNHTHLPKLEQAGIIEWDRCSDTITRGPKFEQVRPLIELLQAHQDELPGDWP